MFIPTETQCVLVYLSANTVYLLSNRWKRVEYFKEIGNERICLHRGMLSPYDGL